MKTVGEIFQLSVQYLDQKQVSRSKFLMQQLLCHVLQIDKISLFMGFDRPLHEEELRVIRSSLGLLVQGKPLEQILGSVVFFGCDIVLTPDVLIPRPETEILMDIISKEIPQESCVAWDICTGSGCIGLSLKKKFPFLSVTLSGICSKALAVAETNADRNGLDVHFKLGDLLEPFKGEKADLVICNPPYISVAEYQGLDRSVKEYEPELALVGGICGDEFYQRLAQDLPRHLNPHAKVYFEIGFSQGEKMLELFSASIWKEKKLINDWSGHNRFFFLEIE